MNDAAPLYLEIHSMLTVWAPALPLPVRRFFCEQLGHFVRERPEPVLPHADIVLAELDKWPAAGPARQMDELYGFWIDVFQDEPAVIFFHRGVPEIMVVPAAPVRIFFRPRPKMARRLHGLLLFCLRLVLARKNLLLCHGAVLEKDGRALYLAGHRGVGKTGLVLHMLRRGWHYLSDDKLIMQNGTAFLYQPFIYLKEHHFEACPWLAGLLKDHPGRSGPRPQWRQGLMALARRHLPRQFMPAVDRWFDPVIKAPVAAFPDCRILPAARPAAVVILVNGPELAVAKISRAAALEDLVQLQRLAFAEFCTLEWMLALYDRQPRPDLRTLIDQNLAAADFSRLTLPEQGDFEEILMRLSG